MRRNTRIGRRQKTNGRLIAREQETMKDEDAGAEGETRAREQERKAERRAND